MTDPGRGTGMALLDGALPVGVPPRFAYRRFMPIGNTPASGYVDYWRGPELQSGVAFSNQGNAGANFAYSLDVPSQQKFIGWSFVGFSSLVMMCVEQSFGGTPPLLPLSPADPATARLLISRVALAWGAGNFANANSGHVNGFWIGPATSGSVQMLPLLGHAQNGFIGVIRSAALGGAIALAYKPVGGARVEVALPGPLALTNFNVFEHRLRTADAQLAARYELFINGVQRAAVDFSTAGTPRYTAANNGVSPIIASGNDSGFDAGAPSMFWRDWELISGDNKPGTIR